MAKPALARKPLSTQVSTRHHAMLDELNQMGLMKNAAVEGGIEMYYAKMSAMGLVGGTLLDSENPSQPDHDPGIKPGIS